jgi:hypothetical protein
MLLRQQSSGPPVGLAVLLAPFIFIPGVYVVANVQGWSRLIRFVASLTYVALSAIVAFVVLSQSVEFMHRL